MYPVTWHIDLFGRGFEVGAYSLCLALAILIVLLGGLWNLRGLSRPRIAVILSSATIATLAGARVLNLLVNSSHAFSWARAFEPSFSHFSLYGGLVAGGAAAAIATVAMRLPLWQIADAMTIPLAAGIAVIRLGCFFRGCCFGVECDWPWGIVFPCNSPAHLFQMMDRPFAVLGGPMPVHPTQLYEVAAAAIAVFAAMWWRRLQMPPGTCFLVAAICFTSFRWLNLLYRAPIYATESNRWFYPVVYFIILITSAIAIRLLCSIGVRKADKERA